MEVLLKRKDKEAEDVRLNLAEGKPIDLGRGPLLKCSATKISRKHAEIYVDSTGRVMLKSASKSPTLVIHKGSEKEIVSGEELELHDNDQISLLEDEYVYKVTFATKKSAPTNVTDTVMLTQDDHHSEAPHIAETVPIPATVAPEVPHVDSPTPVKSDSDTESATEAEWEKISPEEVSAAPQMDYIEAKKTEPTTTDETEEKSDESPAKEVERKLPAWMKTSTESAAPGKKAVRTPKVAVAPTSVTPKKRGRKPKSQVEKETEDVGPSCNNTSSRAKRNATKKVDYSYSEDFLADSDELEESEEEEKPSGRNVGRPAFQSKKAAKKRKVSDDDYDEDEVVKSKNNSDDDSDWGGSKKKPAGLKRQRSSPRGRPKKAAGSRARDSVSASEDDDSDTSENYIPRPSRRRSTQGSSQTPPVAEEKSPAKSTARKKREAKVVKAKPVEEEEEEIVKQPEKSDKSEKNDDNSTSSSQESSAKPTTSDDLAKTPTKPKRRKVCMFGAKCYRKNPQHKEEFCHPGDEDYRSDDEGEEDESDDRPECEFGTDCFRKNPDHRKEFSHTRPPIRRAAKKAIERLENDFESGPNEYDMNDSFIDDETPQNAAEDEESDYSPSDDDEKPKKKKRKAEAKNKESDDDEIKDLVEEAKEFKQNRKMWEPAAKP